jgi:beta-glucosidase-like glycosyl hydrolase/CubicO group peptidase (beta-lactamase class C family)
MAIKKSVTVSLIVLSYIFSSFTLRSQTLDPPFLKYMNHPWVDSILKTLTLEQQVAQCIWIAGYSNRDISHEVEVADIIRNYGIGGIVFFQGTAEKQSELTNFYQKISNVPLIISMDAEWGVGMRLDNIEKFPYQMTLGAIRNDSLIYLMGRAVADQCRRLGVHINLAPVADINNNPLNPVINYRSFGENRENVTTKAIMYMKGMQDNGVMATVKHFPGHGDTKTDSHYDLPVITHPVNRLDSVELFPFLNLINEGAGSVMTAHLNLPSLDPTASLPSTLSPVIINDLLKTHMGFKGLVITDAMNMRGVTKYFGPGEAEARALSAGNDVIEFVTDVGAAVREVQNHIRLKKLTSEEITLKCRKVLAMKYWAGLSHYRPVNINNITDEISSYKNKALIRELYINSLTVLNNKEDIIPIKNLESVKIATLAINRGEVTTFQKRISNYLPADHYFLDPADKRSQSELINKLSGYDIVITGIFRTDQRPQNLYGIRPEMIDFLQKLSGTTKTIITYFGNPYAIAHLESVWNSDGLIITYQENDFTEDLSAQLIFGGIGASGSLPVSISGKWPSGFGIRTRGNIRLQYGFPESADMSSEKLDRKIDSIAVAGIRAGAYPGCQVMAARKGIVIFHKTYGFHTYENRIRLEKDDIFDLASVTKVSATLPGLMLLNSQGSFSPDEKLGFYLDEFSHSDKKDLIMRDLLTHQAGLTAWIPFWRETVRKDENLKKTIFRPEQSKRYEEKVADHLYINRNYRDRIFTEIKQSPLGEKRYVYSDLAFILAPEIIERLTGEKWYNFVTRSVYLRIGAFDIGFNPYLRYPLSRIVPTEYDSLFRRQLLHGTVHDEGAAMLGGISGHAGLFSTANDLMKLMELYRRMGEYGGEQIIAEEIFREYTRVQFPENKNRRGLGFDKPLLDNEDLPYEKAYPSKGASPESYGHSGYTGTFVWIDPVYEISYVFLSNRVYPTRNNNLLSDLNIRTNILQALYDSVEGKR